MTLGQLLTTFWRRADDRATPRAWPQEDATLFANQAVDEAAERSLALKDSATPRICEVALVPGEQQYPLDPRVIDVAMVRVRGLRGQLTREGDEEAFLACPADGGIPQAYALYQRGSGVVLVLDRPAPDPATLGATNYQPYLDLTVYRRALAPMVELDDCPELPPTQHADLVEWMLHLAFSTRDVDDGSEAKASVAEARFAAAFGAKIDRNVKRKQLRHRPPVVKSARW